MVSLKLSNSDNPNMEKSVRASLQKKRRPVRQNSNVFAMFDQKQISNFREAFYLIDHDQDGFIDKDDLKDMLASLGLEPTDKDVESMLQEAPGCINFTMFLTIMGEKMMAIDTGPELLNAFKVLDENNTGGISLDTLCDHLLSNKSGGGFTEEEVEEFLSKIPNDSKCTGLLKYEEWIRALKYGVAT